MVRQLIFAAAAAAAAAGSARAQDGSIARLLEEAAAASPEVAQARAEVAAERARIPQAGAWPDATLTRGIQNDGFKGIEVGTMETSFFNIMLTQPLYWPGKRGLREDVATLEAKRAEARLQRALLDVEARTRRAFIALLLVRGRIDLLEEEERLWAQAEHAARSRYESGQVPQSDLLRAQLERARLQQRRFAIDAERVAREAEVNRIRNHPLDEPLPVAARLADLPDPAVLQEAEVQKDAETRSPEVRAAMLGVEQAGRRLALARKERLPDFAVTAAIMPRGSLDPMWQLGVSVGLPIFAGRKQNRAVDENEQRRIGASQGAETLKQVLRLRTRERLAALSALNRANQQYRTQVLVLSAATVRSTSTQYEVGRLPFAAVLEALTGYVSDKASYLGSLAEAQLAAIAQQELSLDAMPQAAAGVAGAMPGTGAITARPGAAAAGTPSSSAEAASPTRGMNGM
ncbi:MAG: TolC family protein [Deltaproteobacteria bacterium]